MRFSPGCCCTVSPCEGGLPTELHLEDDVLGMVTLTYDHTNGWWEYCGSVSYPGFAGSLTPPTTCPAGSFVIRWRFLFAFTPPSTYVPILALAYERGGDNCPIDGSCPNGFDTFIGTGGGGGSFALISQQCEPDFEVVFGAPSNTVIFARSPGHLVTITL